MNARHKAIAASFRMMAATGADRWSRGFAQGAGVILTLHHVRETKPRGFAPNALLDITPAFVDRALRLIRGEGYDIVSLQEALARLRNPKPGRFFVALTFDDGYRDNVEHAWPILAKHGAPWTLFVTPGAPDKARSVSQGRHSRSTSAAGSMPASAVRSEIAESRIASGPRRRRQ